MWKSSYIVKLLLGVTLLLACEQIAVAAEIETPDARPKVTPLGNQSCVLAGSMTTFRYDVAGAGGARVHVDWTLLVDGRPIDRGVVDADVTDSGGVAIPIPLPVVRPGVVLPATLRLTFSIGQTTRSVERLLVLFDPHPFALRKSLLERTNIQLFDLEGETVKVFDASSIPYRRLPSVESIAGVTAGTLIVGEGIAFDEHRGLAESSLAVASRGVSVLVLSPRPERVALLNSSALGSATLPRVELRGPGVLRQFDKRFDMTDWGGEPSVASTVRVQAEYGDESIGISDDGSGWPWLTAEVAAPESDDPPGRFIVCGFGVIRQWHSSPVPRHLLAQILESFVEPGVGSIEE